MMSLEDEISHLQKENYRIEAQLGRMKGEIPGLLVGDPGAGGQDKVGSWVNLVDLDSSFHI